MHIYVYFYNTIHCTLYNVTPYFRCFSFDHGNVIVRIDFYLPNQEPRKESNKSNCDKHQVSCRTMESVVYISAYMFYAK